MTAPTTLGRRRLTSSVINPKPVDLELTIEEVMADLDPGWLVWRDQSDDDKSECSPAA